MSHLHHWRVSFGYTRVPLSTRVFLQTPRLLRLRKGYGSLGPWLDQMEQMVGSENMMHDLVGCFPGTDWVLDLEDLKS